MVLYEIIDSLIDKNIISVFLGIYNLIVYKCAWNAIVDKNVSSATWFSYCGFFLGISMVLILLRAISLFNKGHNVIFIISYTTTETIVLVGLTWNINKIKSKIILQELHQLMKKIFSLNRNLMIIYKIPLKIIFLFIIKTIQWKISEI